MKFQLTRSRGAWLAICDNLIVKGYISTHTLTWSVTLHFCKWHLHFIFQLTRSRGAWQQGDLKLFTYGEFQLTRSRGAWHGCCKCYSYKQYISTHTLTWSVTALNGNYGGYPNISTHTLTWSVTCEMPDAVENDSWISTHTLTWSVTLHKKIPYLQLFLFQLTRSRGAWLTLLRLPRCNRRFQLTRSRGAWPVWV